jgi:acetyl esterase/lipase
VCRVGAVIHGGKDYRIVDGEGIATFQALQRQGVPSELLYFPGENHWCLNPSNSIIWHDKVLAWLRRWVGAPHSEATSALPMAIPGSKPVLTPLKVR